MKEKALTGGGLPLHEMFREKSAEAVLVGEKRRPGESKIRRGRRLKPMKGRTIGCSKCDTESGKKGIACNKRDREKKRNKK